MYQELRNLRAMRLVRCPGRVELDGTDNPFDLASDEEDCTGVGCSNGPSPPVFSALERERHEKTHGSFRLDRVDQKLSESSEIGITHRQNQSLDHVCLLGHGWLTQKLTGGYGAQRNSRPVQRLVRHEVPRPLGLPLMLTRPSGAGMSPGKRP